MNRQFKIEFHNGEPDEKTIVTMAVTVNNGKRFKNLDADGLKKLYNNLYKFKSQLEGFMVEIQEKNKASKS